MIPEVPEHHKAITKYITTTWRARPQIKVWSVKSGSSVKLATTQLEKFPMSNAVAFSTVGLSDFGGFEIIATTALKNKSYVKAIYDIGSYIIDGVRTAEPGATFQKVLAPYYSKSNVSHILLTTLPLPNLLINELHLDSKVIRWLYAWPLTSDELIALDKEGLTTFEERLKRLQIQGILSLDRNTFPGVEHFNPWKAGS